MKTRYLVLPISLLVCASCDKAKDLADQTSAAMVGELKRQVGVKEPLPGDDPIAQAIDQTEDGVSFRKDLPFPTKIEVKTTITKKVSARFFHSSQLGNNVENVKGTMKQVMVVQRDGNQVTYQLKEAKFTVPALEPEQPDQEIANPLQQVEPAKHAIIFQFDGKAWKADESNFKSLVLSKALSPVFDQLLVEYALEPRPLWFSSARMKVGAEVSVSDALLPMVVTGNASGKMKLKLEGVEQVNGHPCAVFAVTGDYSRKEFPDFQGGLTDEDVTIESGKLWLSLLYPVILKEELDTIQTFRPGGNSGVKGRGQGTIQVKIEREWKAEGMQQAIKELAESKKAQD